MILFFYKLGGVNVNNRVKKVRKTIGLTQDDFGKRLGISNTAVSKIEKAENKPSEQTIILMCQEFGVNENWLRTGEGGDDNMFVQATPYEKAYNRFGYIMENSSPSKKAALTMLLEVLYSVPDDKWDMIMKEYDEIKKED